MKVSALYYLSAYILLLAAYNPATTYVINATGFHGAALHQVMMQVGWCIFLIVNLRIALEVISYRFFISLFGVLAYSTFSLVNGISHSTMMISLADVSYFIEVWMFYWAAIISIRSSTAESNLRIYKNIFIFNALGLVIVFLFFKNDLYHTLQIGPIRISRALDFLVISGLLLVLYGKKGDKSSKSFFWALLILFVFANIVGFSRGVWFAFILILMIDFFFKIFSSLYFQRVSIKKLQILQLASLFFILTYLQVQFSAFEIVIERLFDFNVEDSSIGGRFMAYGSLFTATFNNIGIFTLGQGAGALLPGFNFAASSSPSFFGTVLYVHGFFVFFLILTAFVILAYKLFKLSFQPGARFGKFPFYNLIVHLVILNIFPSTNHFPILGFLVFISVILLKAKGEQ